MAKKWFTLGSNDLLWNRPGFYGNFSKLYEKKRQKHESKTNGQNLLQSNFCKAHYYSKANTRSQK